MKKKNPLRFTRRSLKQLSDATRFASTNMHNKVFRFLVRFFLSIFIRKSERVCSLVKCLKSSKFSHNRVYFKRHILRWSGVAVVRGGGEWYILECVGIDTVPFLVRVCVLYFLKRNFRLPSCSEVVETALNVELIFLLPPVAYLQKYPFYFEYKKVKQNFPHVYKIGIIYHNELSLFLSLVTH